MKEVYRKAGRVVRRENAMLVRVDEAGEAVEESAMFSAAPLDHSGDWPEVEASDVIATADGIERIVTAPLVLERMIVSEGAAFHEFATHRWTDRARRVHLSIARAPHRVLIDVAEFSLDAIRRVVAPFERMDGERILRRVRLAPNVGAALLPHLIGEVPIQQWAAPNDGKGEWIANVAVERGTPPNWFRPSYRSRPVRAWFHLMPDAFGEIDSDVPEAIALLAPIHDRTMRVLCVEGERAFAAAITVDRITAVKPSNEWFPYASGCFGAEVMLECRIE